MRVAAQRPQQQLLYEPRAVVHHFVPAERVSWHYFWRRSFFVNVEKVQAFADMGEAANIRAEGEFVRRAVTKQLAADIRAGLRGDANGLLRMGAMIVGISMAGAGHLFGRAQSMFYERPWK
jgi:hypothetical protein